MAETFNKRLVNIILPYFLLVSCMISCSSTRESQETVYVIIGRIQVIGNEPFTKLAVETEARTTYVLKCEKDVEKTLAEHQGQFVKIHYNGIEAVPEGTLIHVVSAELLQR